MNASDDPRRGGFSFGKLGEEFDDEFTNTVRNLCDAERAKVIPPENVAHYSHGHQWLELQPHGGWRNPNLKSIRRNTVFNWKTFGDTRSKSYPST